jgi:hypothetical protein
MAKNIGDYSRVRTKVDLTRSAGVTQHVAAEVGSCQTGHRGMLDHNVSDRCRASQRGEWQLALKKQIPGRYMRRSSVAKIKGHGLREAGNSGNVKAVLVFGRITCKVAAFQLISSSRSPITSPAPKP